jgi:hypothetical protein
MQFNKAIDELPLLIKIIFAIIPVLSLVFVIYRIIADVTAKRTDLTILDILLGICPLPFVYWILNLIYLVIKGNIFSFGEWVKPSAAL